jgi:hypothetical protein
MGQASARQLGGQPIRFFASEEWYCCLAYKPEAQARDDGFPRLRFGLGCVSLLPG